MLLLLFSSLSVCAELTPDDPMYVPPRKKMSPMLQIGVTKKVENCTQRVQKGDEVEVYSVLYSSFDQAF